MNSVSMPSVSQIQPPHRAMKIVMTWLIDTPVEMVALTSSGLSDRSFTYTLEAIDASEMTASSTYITQHTTYATSMGNT